MKPLGILLLALFLTVPLSAADRPNILWITSEDNGPHLGCYGDTYAVTPNLDKLGAKGMRYVNAWSNAPVCAPARTTIISGLYPTSTGAEHMRSEVPLPPGFKMYPQFLREAGYFCTNRSKEDYNLTKPGQVWDPKGHYKNRAPGQPFFAIFNHTISHESQMRNEIPAENKIHDPAKVRVPAYHPDTPETRANWAQYYDRLTMMDTLAGENLAELEAAGLAEDTIIFYYGDHGSGMPRNKRWPYNSGLNVPLIVYFPEKWKHLAPKDYQAGGASTRMVSFVDLAPTLLSIAGLAPADWMQGRAFAGPHEAKAPEYNFGFRGRMDERIDLVRSVRDARYVYLRQYQPHRIYGQYLNYMFQTQTTRKWHELFLAGKLNEAQSHFWRPKPVEELYDLQKDPDEVTNLANDPEYVDVLSRMRGALSGWMEDVRDIGLLPEYEMIARSKAAGVSPYEMGHDPKLYDFPAVSQAANLASMGTAEENAANLKSADSAVRYWGATGLLMKGEAALPHRDALLAALKDPSPIVQITAAEALGRFGSEADAALALDVLMKLIQPEGDAYAALAAWNALDYLDERARPALEKIRDTPDKLVNAPNRAGGDYIKRLKEKVLADLER